MFVVNGEKLILFVYAHAGFETKMYSVPLKIAEKLELGFYDGKYLFGYDNSYKK